MKVFKATDSNYKSISIEVTIGKTIFLVQKVTGNSNYINISKLTNNPYLTAGKQFENFDQAITNYKNVKMKVALINFENEINKIASI